MGEHVTLDELADRYRERRRAELLPEVDTSSFDQRDEEWYDTVCAEAERTIEGELRDVTRAHVIERGFSGARWDSCLAV